MFFYKSTGRNISIRHSHVGRAALLAVGMVMASGVLTSCHTGRKSTSDQHAAVETIHVGHADKTQRRIVDEALTWVGTPYLYAGQTKGEGTDCSGLVMKVYEDVTGRKLPRNSAKQAEYCTQLKPDEVATGDLVFFATGKDPDRVSHVGIVVDDRKFVHASASKGVVVSDIYSSYYQRTFKMFGRVPEKGKDDKDNDGDLATND